MKTPAQTKVSNKLLRVLACLALLLAETSASAQTLQPGSDGASVLNTTSKRHLTSMTTADGPNGLRITIETSGPVNDAVGYRSGENYVVIIPQAEMSSLQIDMRLLNNLRIEKRDDDIALSFKLEAGRKAQLSHEQNQVVVTLSQSERSTVAAASAPLVISSPSVASVLPATPATSSSVQPIPQATPDVFDRLQALFNSDSVEVGNLDLSTPESPAFTVLSLTPQTIVRPATPREFASALVNGLDKNGNFQSGLAIDTAPYLLLNGRNVTLKEYNKNRLIRFLTRTQFSFAAVKGSSDDDPTTKLSMGLNFTLYDDGDPRIHREGQKDDVLSCFDSRLQFTVPPVPPRMPNDTDADWQAKFEAFRQAVLSSSNAVNIAEECREAGRKRNWNKTSWSLAFAPSWISKTGDSSDFKWNGGAIWSSYAIGVGDSGQVILHGRYRAKEQIPDEDNEGSFINQNSALFGGRFRMGNPSVGFNIEGAFVHNRPENKPTKNTYEFSLGLEKRLAPNVYFVITAGSKGPQTESANSKGFVITSFKYGFSKKPKLATEN